MTLDEFLYNIHFDIDKASDPNWQVDWDDAPLPYKLYSGLPAIPLSYEIPITLEEPEAPKTPDLRRIGHFLWYVYGLTQFSQSAFTLDTCYNSAELMQSYRRFAPSGGALYPNELYMYLKIEDLPAGIYHYDLAHHRLLLLREGNFDSYIARALGNRCAVSACFGTIFVSTMFWKNFFKYNNFAYRLQGLDTGVLMGQIIETTNRFGFESGVYFQFLDRAINHLLGLSDQEESVYAIIPLTVEPTIWSFNGKDSEGIVTAAELCRELPAIQFNHYVRSRTVKEYPMLIKMNEASFQDSTQLFRQIPEKDSENLKGQPIYLPYVKRLSNDLASVCRKRFSPDMDFVLGKVSLSQLANLMQEATGSFKYRNDLEDPNIEQDPRVLLFGCLYNVEGIPNGGYQYDITVHALRQVHEGDHRLLLQSGMSLDNVNLLQVPLCFHVVGDKDYYKASLGYRGYRIQQMEAGILVQRLLLAASAIGMNGHPLLGFDVNLCDELYKLVLHEKTSLIQLPIGFYRNRPWLKGSLHG
ncbi:SagB family peptide dehydrogenase [Cytobacillus sp. Hz8]|uniref:SagB family peptide dehydrogenase n=1 Tax=Cytobacillus sp. Hz8 TaxID=3347168 RepID=UPI0035D8ED8E